MSYNASVPVATTSPSLFPALAQTNWGRLQTIIEADHQFNLASAANDGYHNLIHMQIPATLPTGALPSLGRLYANTTAQGVELFYMDSNGDSFQLTPLYVNLVRKFAGSQSLGSGGTTSIFNQSFDYTGFATAYINDSTTYSVYSLMKSGGVANRERISETGSSAPDLSYSGTDLILRNDSSSTATIVWSLMINRL